MTAMGIETTIDLVAPLERVWRAIADSHRFGAWFGVEIEGPFIVGEEAAGRIVPTKVDADVAKLQEPYCGFPWRVDVAEIEPMKRFSFRWRPFAVDPAVDYAPEPKTLVAFELQPEGGGTRLTITETGFEHIPASRREEAMKANEGGWIHQSRLIAKYLQEDER